MPFWNSKKKEDSPPPAPLKDSYENNRGALPGKPDRNLPSQPQNPYANGPAPVRNGYDYESAPQSGNGSFGKGYGDDRRAPRPHGDDRQAPQPSNGYADGRRPNPPNGLPSGPARNAGPGGYSGAQRGPPPPGGFGSGPRPAAKRAQTVPDMDHEASKQDLFGGARQRAQQGPPLGAGAGPRPGINRAQSAQSVDTDFGKRELFGGARERAQQREQQRPGPYGGREGPDGGDRQASAEDDEEEDVEAIKQEIRFVKQESVASTRNALKAAAAAEESGMNALNSLSLQGERLHNVRKNLDLADNGNRTAAEHARELKTLNRSMFAVHVKNPFNSTARNKEREQATIARFEEEKAERDATRQFGYESKTRIDNALKDMSKQSRYGQSQRSAAERGRYQFEADEEDEEMEREIEDNLDQIHAAASRLKNLAGTVNAVLDDQNATMKKIDGKVSCSRSHHSQAIS